MTDKRQVTTAGRLGNERGRRTAVDALLEPDTVLALMLLGLALAVVLSAAPGEPARDLTHFGLAALLIQWVIALSLGTIHLLRKPLRRLGMRWVMLVLTAIVIVVTVASALVGWTLLAGTDAPLSDLADFLARSAIIALAMSSAAALVALNAARWQQTRTELAQAELRHLQARVRPHFLFNALNTATAFLPHRPAEAESVLLDLADLFRAALREAQTHPLADELELTRRYLDIEQRRLQDRLTIEWNVPPAPTGLEVPTFCIQALAENAVHHGIEPSGVPGRLSVTLSAAHDALHILLVNTLPEEGTERRRENGQGIGLRGVRARLDAHFGGDAELRVDQIGTDFGASLRLPLQATTR